MCLQHSEVARGRNVSSLVFVHARKPTVFLCFFSSRCNRVDYWDDKMSHRYMSFFLCVFTNLLLQFVAFSVGAKKLNLYIYRANK